MRLIDADALQRHKQLEAFGNGQYEDVDIVYGNDIDNAPTIEAEPLRHGEWTRAGEPPLYIIECSECRQLFFHHAGLSLPKYCSECGTKMGGDVK